MDQRGQAIGIARFFMSLGVAAVIYMIVTQVTTPLLDHAGNQTSGGSTGAQATTHLTEAVTWLPLGFATIAFFGLIAYSVFSREVR